MLLNISEHNLLFVFHLEGGVLVCVSDHVQGQIWGQSRGRIVGQIPCQIQGHYSHKIWHQLLGFHVRKSEIPLLVPKYAFTKLNVNRSTANDSAMRFKLRSFLAQLPSLDNLWSLLILSHMKRHAPLLLVSMHSTSASKKQIWSKSVSSLCSLIFRPS